MIRLTSFCHIAVTFPNVIDATETPMIIQPTRFAVPDPVIKEKPTNLESAIRTPIFGATEMKAVEIGGAPS